MSGASVFAVRPVSEAPVKVKYGETPEVRAIGVNATVPVAVSVPPRKVLPATSRRLVGEVVPMPMLRLLFKMVKATLLEKPVEDAMLNDLSVELYPMFQALASEANWKFASPVPELSPIVVRPELSTLKSVVVAVAVDEAIENKVVFVSPLLA